jgi:DegV family protein with EDD domain
MSYKIIGDSCCDLPKEYREDHHFDIASLTIDIDGYKIVDDNTFDQKLLLEKMKASHNSPKTSCPSPEAYMKAFDCDAEDIYCVTLSSQLSGSYNSAELGKNLYHEEKGNKNIHIFDSRSAACGEALIAMKIDELSKQGKTFEQIIEEVTQYRDEMNTLFVLESLDNLRKNGRLSNIQATLANVLNIKPVMGANSEGQIIKIDQVRGMKKALLRMIDVIAECKYDLSKRDLAIAHCNCYDRAVEVKNDIEKRHKFRNIIIVPTAGISSVYANDGGIIVTY